MRRRAQDPGRLGLFERLMFSFMGPPQVGDGEGAARVRPDRPVERCTRCRQPYEDHEVVRDPGLTYTRCPAVLPSGE